MTKKDEQQGDELLKRMWQMPPRPHSKLTKKRKKKKTKSAKRR